MGGGTKEVRGGPQETGGPRFFSVPQCKSHARICFLQSGFRLIFIGFTLLAGVVSKIWGSVKSEGRGNRSWNISPFSSALWLFRGRSFSLLLGNEGRLVKLSWYFWLEVLSWWAKLDSVEKLPGSCAGEDMFGDETEAQPF